MRLRRRTPSRGIQLRDAMREPDRAWYITRTNAGWYHLVRELGGGEFYDWDFREVTGLAGGFLTHMLAQARIGIPMLPADDDVATYAGTWVHGAAGVALGYTPVTTTGSINSSSGALTATTPVFHSGSVGRGINIAGAGAAGGTYTGSVVAYTDPTHVTVSPNATTTVAGAAVTVWPGYHYSTVAGSTATWTTPAGATSVGMIVVRSTNGGLMKVTVNGSTATADLLPTAQSVVDDGSYPNTILVGNGGTLNPTDRVINCYSGSVDWAATVAVTKGLTAGTHTVQAVATGYTRTGASGNRAYVTGFCHGSEAITPATANALTIATTATLSGLSATEPVYRFVPAGSSYNDFLGRVHGYETTVALTVEVDGAPAGLVDGAAVAVPAGSAAALTLTTTLRHPDVAAGATPVGNVTYVYTLDGEGLTVETTHSNLFTANMTSGYGAMLPADGRFDRYTSSGLFRTLTINVGNGTQNGNAKAWVAALWTSVDRYALSAEVLNIAEAVNGWARSAPGLVYCEDRAPVSGTKTNKVYFSRVGSSSTPEAVSAATVLHTKTVYRVKRFPGGAETTLGAI